MQPAFRSILLAAGSLAVACTAEIDGGAGAGGNGGPGGAGAGAAAGAPSEPVEANEPAPPLCRVELRCASEIADEPKIDCALRIEDGAELEVYADRVGIERRGRSSLQYDKPNYSLELRDAAGNEKPVNLLGMGAESDWILDGSWVDRSLVRNELAFALFRSLGPERWAPRGRFCELWLDDESRGIYRLGERIKRDDDRIDIPLDDGSGQSFVVKQDSEGALRWNVGEQEVWKLVSPPEERAAAAQLEGVQAFLDVLDEALRNTDPTDATRDPFALLDLDALVDFVIVQDLVKSVDAYNLSLHLWKAPGAPAQFVPWDFDLSIGQPESDIRPGHELPSGWVVHRTLLSDGFDRLPTFRTRLGERWRAHRQGPLAEPAILAFIDRALETLTPGDVEENFRIWPLGDVAFEHIYNPYTLYPVSSHAEEIARVRAWLHDRLAWIDTHVDAYPE